MHPWVRVSRIDRVRSLKRRLMGSKHSDRIARSDAIFDVVQDMKHARGAIDLDTQV